MIQYNGKDTQGRFKGPSLARKCGSHLRRSDAQGSDEDQEERLGGHQDPGSEIRLRCVR